MLRFTEAVRVEDAKATTDAMVLRNGGLHASLGKSMKKRRVSESSSDEDDNENIEKDDNVKRVADSRDEDEEDDEDLGDDDMDTKHEETAEERKLEALVFGSTTSMLDNMNRKKIKSQTKAKKIKKKIADSFATSQETKVSIADRINDRKPAWHDNDDDTT